jgi:hypothetical protein
MNAEASSKLSQGQQRQAVLLVSTNMQNASPMAPWGLLVGRQTRCMQRLVFDGKPLILIMHFASNR